MNEYWYTSTGKSVDKISRNACYLIQELGPHNYSMQRKDGSGRMRSILTGDFVRVSGMFLRQTGVELKFPISYLNALGKTCAEEGAVWCVSGKRTSIWGVAGWQLCDSMGKVDIYHYDDEDIACTPGRAASIYAVLPNGLRVALHKDYTIASVVDEPYSGVYHYFTRDMKDARATTAYYRVKRAGRAFDVSVKSGSQWMCIGSIPAFKMTSEILRIGVKEEGRMYLDADMKVCDQAVAVYTLVTRLPGILVKLYKGDTCIFTGTPAEVKDFRPAKPLPEPKPEPEPEPEEVAEQVELEIEEPAPAADPQPCPSIHTSAALIARLESLMMEPAYLKGDLLFSYLALAMWRNRAMKKGPVFNTRLTDVFGQDIYLADTSYNGYGVVSNPHLYMNRLRIVMSLEEARTYDPNLQALPAPIQWSDKVSDYFWNPTIPLRPLNIGNLQHICVERKDRLPEELQAIEPSILMQSIKQNLEQGAQRARIDVRYALPSYSRTHDEVSMLLPIRLPLLYGSKVIAAALLAKGPLGYSLKTVITTEMARRSVSLFTDPDTTWLKECE